jgi:hypothetical protein
MQRRSIKITTNMETAGIKQSSPYLAKECGNRRPAIRSVMSEANSRN